MIALESLDTVSYSHSIVTMAVFISLYLVCKIYRDIGKKSRFFHAPPPTFDTPVTGVSRNTAIMLASLPTTGGHFPQILDFFQGLKIGVPSCSLGENLDFLKIITIEDVTLWSKLESTSKDWKTKRPSTLTGVTFGYLIDSVRDDVSTVQELSRWQTPTPHHRQTLMKTISPLLCYRCTAGKKFTTLLWTCEHVNFASDAFPVSAPTLWNNLPRMFDHALTRPLSNRD